ncbi:MAG: GNAT family N-acetyltransferase [Bacteroidetes bacterium]|nr:GNAT family N-acetyltransferase [Bacteroidota bacterium]
MLYDTEKKTTTSALTIPLHKEFSYAYYTSIHDFGQEEWEAALPYKNFFLDYRYLKCVEELKADQNYFRYAIVYRKHQPIGVVYFQVSDFTASLFGKLIETQFNALSKGKLSLFQAKLQKHNNSVLMRLLTCGNNYVSGEHGFLFDSSLQETLKLDILERLIAEVAKKEKLRGRISGMLIKDFYSPLPLSKCMFGTSNYMEFKVEPNMIVDIPDQVSSLTEYIGCFSKKYRNRAKQILKAGSALEVRELNEQEILALYDAIFALYEQVYNNAKFKLAKLDARYFYEMKKIFRERFIMVGYFRDGKLVSFLSAIRLEHELEAHYIGVDYSINKELELYQNLLYKYIELAIERRIKRVNLGRTASEIKSTVGAKAYDLHCYVRPQNTLSKLVLKPFCTFLQPSEWIPRNPFKEE